MKRIILFLLFIASITVLKTHFMVDRTVADKDDVSDSLKGINIIEFPSGLFNNSCKLSISK